MGDWVFWNGMRHWVSDDETVELIAEITKETSICQEYKPDAPLKTRTEIQSYIKVLRERLQQAEMVVAFDRIQAQITALKWVLDEPVPCPLCKGTGKLRGPTDDGAGLHDCPSCKGTGDWRKA